jgi:hypothetical protein
VKIVNEFIGLLMELIWGEVEDSMLPKEPFQAGAA